MRKLLLCLMCNVLLRTGLLGFARLVDGERIIDGSHYYFSHYSGAVKTNYWHTWSIEIRRQEPFAKTYNEYYGSDGRRYYGWHRVGDQLYYFDYNGRVENDLTIFKGQNYLFDNHGKLVKDAFYIQSLRVFEIGRASCRERV